MPDEISAQITDCAQNDQNKYEQIILLNELLII